jgi:hypothetical protein
MPTITGIPTIPGMPVAPPTWLYPMPTNAYGNHSCEVDLPCRCTFLLKAPYPNHCVERSFPGNCSSGSNEHGGQCRTVFPTRSFDTCADLERALSEIGALCPAADINNTYVIDTEDGAEVPDPFSPANERWVGNSEMLMPGTSPDYGNSFSSVTNPCKASNLTTRSLCTSTNYNSSQICRWSNTYTCTMTVGRIFAPFNRVNAQKNQCVPSDCTVESPHPKATCYLRYPVPTTCHSHGRTGDPLFGDHACYTQVARNNCAPPFSPDSSGVFCGKQVTGGYCHYP